MTIAEGELTRLAYCWTIQRSDGAGLALTSHDRPLDLQGIHFRPNPAITPSAIVRTAGLTGHSTEVAGVLSHEAITASDLLTGRWDEATVELSAVEWGTPDAQPRSLLQGRLGAIAMEDDGFTADLHGAAAKMDRPLCPVTSPSCRAELGDKSCRVDLAGRTKRMRVTGVEDNLIILDGELDALHLFGRLRFLSGANCGWSSAILTVSGNSARIRDVPRMAVELGCKVEVREGCDKRLATCAQRFANAVNFRGEPHLPGTDLLTRYPGA